MGTLAWHFIGDTLLNGDPVPEDGEPLRFFDEIVWCESGLYASPRVLNALEYAPGSTLCRVTCDHIQKEEWDKFVCRERTILKRADILPALEEFSRWCALEYVHVWRETPTLYTTRVIAITSDAANAAYLARRRRRVFNFGPFDEQMMYECQEAKLLELIKKSFDFSVT